MADNIWVSALWRDTSLLKPLQAGWESESKERYMRAYELHERGRWVPPDDFQDSLYVRYYDRFEKHLPDVSLPDGFLVVTARCAEVMSKFELGKGSFVPIKLFQHDRARRVEGEYFIFNFEAQKDTFDPENSTGGFRKPYHHSDELWLDSIKNDYELAVKSSASGGADLWTDPALWKAIFASDRLVRVLKSEGLSRRFGFKKCKSSPAETQN